MNIRFNFDKPVIYYWILFTAIVVYFLTAYNSHGYCSADEQFQIIEFAKLKAGINHARDMTWEYHRQIRSTIQPTICLLLFQLSNIVNVKDPYTFGLILRLFSVFFSLYIIHRFIISTDHLIQNKHSKIVYYLLSYFIWFTPFISVHFSSETWGGLFFLHALTIYFSSKPENRKFFIIGCILGLSFLFRFQMAFAAIGFVLWLVLIDNCSFKKVMYLISGGVLILFIGTLIDYWFYEKLVFTPWNYFYANIIEGIASEFGTSPWYTYIQELFCLPSYFLGTLLILALLLLTITKPKNIFIWCFLPFFIAHSFISHKEERFMFPLAYLLPIMLMLAHERLAVLINASILRIANYVFVFIFIIVNSIGLIAVITRFGGNSKMVIVKYIHDQYGDKPIHLIQSNWGDVYDKHGGITPYAEKEMNLLAISNLCDLNDSILKPGMENLLVVQKRSLQMKSCTSVLTENHFVMEKQSLPAWVEWLNDNNIYNCFDKLDIYVLYRKKY